MTANDDLQHEQTADINEDASLAQLMEMFDGVDAARLASALRACRGNVLRAADLLLQEQLQHSGTTASAALLDNRHPNKHSNTSNSSGNKQKRQSSLLSTFGSTSKRHQSSASTSPVSTRPARSTRSTPNTPTVDLNSILKWNPDADAHISKTIVRLFTPDQIARHTPCVLIQNILPSHLADELLRFMLTDSTTWQRRHFYLFDRAVDSPHTKSFYIDPNKVTDGTRLYYGGEREHYRQFNELMYKTRDIIEEVTTRVLDEYGRHEYERPGKWTSNASAANRYSGAAENVGWHSDRLTYIGPMATIASLSLGATRFFRIQAFKTKPSNTASPAISTTTTTSAESLTSSASADDSVAVVGGGGSGSSSGGGELVPPPRAAGMPESLWIKSPFAKRTIDIQVKHNDLLIMLPGMQESHRHCIPPHPTSTHPLQEHPISGDVRINLTFRDYRMDEYGVDQTLCCRCGIPCELRVVNRRIPESPARRYFYSCAVKEAQNHDCGFFQWFEPKPSRSATTSSDSSASDTKQLAT